MFAVDMPPGGVGPEAGIERQLPSPEFADCSRLATEYGEDKAIGMDIAAAKSDGEDILSYRLASRWNGALFTDESIACRGTLKYSGSVELRSGKYAKRIGENRFTIRTKTQAPARVRAVTIKDTVKASEMCDIASSLHKRKVASVRVVLSEERRYSEGLEAIRTNNSVVIDPLSCNSASESSGGIGPDLGNGSGGVSTR